MITIEEAKLRLEEIKYNRPDWKHTGTPAYISLKGMEDLQKAYDRQHKQEVDELNGLIRVLSRNKLGKQE